MSFSKRQTFCELCGGSYMILQLVSSCGLACRTPALVKSGVFGVWFVTDDAFPTTRRSWIGRKLIEGKHARAELNNHIMHVYAWPLRVYFSGCADRWLGEPDEVIHGFFADRLARTSFLDDWERSGLRLRRWLMNAFSYYLAELRRRNRRDAKSEPLAEDRPGYVDVPERAVDKAFVESIICEALRLAQKECATVGLDQHWGVFVRRTYDGISYNTIASEFGVSAERAAVMARTATRRFRAVLVELLSRDGAPPEELNREIQSLLGAIAS